MQLVADANVLLAAVLGGRARLIIEHPRVEELFTPAVTLEEVQEYALVLARKKRLPQDVLLLAVESLPATVVERETYARSLSEARGRISRRDPDDVDVLALALHVQIPLWSNDHDFRNCGVELLTTAALLRRLGIIA